jgi:hypothetical protein
MTVESNTEIPPLSKCRVSAYEYSVGTVVHDIPNALVYGLGDKLVLTGLMPDGVKRFFVGHEGKWYLVPYGPGFYGMDLPQRLKSPETIGPYDTVKEAYVINVMIGMGKGSL